MSALGQKRTLFAVSLMSALPLKADMHLAVQKCPFSAINGTPRTPCGSLHRDKSRRKAI
jgi:hypothetical protein